MAREKVKVVYVGHADEVEFPYYPGFEKKVRRGEPIDVPAATAGRPPSGDPEAIDLTPGEIAARGLTPYDPGEGLLAQVDAWHLAESATPPAGDDVPTGAKDVVAWVAGDVARAERALEVERSRPTPRARLVAQLEELSAAGAPPQIPPESGGDTSTAGDAGADREA